jgi:putative spermidine/putrescine transport system ATP-binding protein
MDEPLGALDKRLREQVQVELSRIHHRLGLTFVFVTHDQEEALSLSDRIAVFNAGRIEQVATGEELYRRPETLFVASFLGDSTILPGSVSGDGVTSEHWTIRCARKPGFTDGVKAAVIVRPERMRILRDGESATDGQNVIDGTVTDVSYLGTARRVVLRLASGEAGLVREHDDSGARPGDAVRVVWSVDDGTMVAATDDDLRRIADTRIRVAAPA